MCFRTSSTPSFILWTAHRAGGAASRLMTGVRRDSARVPCKHVDFQVIPSGQPFHDRSSANVQACRGCAERNPRYALNVLSQLAR